MIIYSKDEWYTTCHECKILHFDKLIGRYTCPYFNVLDPSNLSCEDAVIDEEKMEHYYKEYELVKLKEIPKVSVSYSKTCVNQNIPCNFRIQHNEQFVECLNEFHGNNCREIEDLKFHKETLDIIERNVNAGAVSTPWVVDYIKRRKQEFVDKRGIKK